jgi:murein DD-endopeptidase MepM/ murein hydrolase activator NlpD
MNISTKNNLHGILKNKLPLFIFGFFFMINMAWAQSTKNLGYLQKEFLFPKNSELSGACGFFDKGSVDNPEHFLNTEYSGLIGNSDGDAIEDIDLMPEWVKALQPDNGKYYSGSITTEQCNELRIGQSQYYFAHPDWKIKILLRCGPQTVFARVYFLRKNPDAQGNQIDFQMFYGRLKPYDFFTNENVIFEKYFPPEKMGDSLSESKLYCTRCLSFMNLVLFYKNEDAILSNLFVQSAKDKKILGGIDIYQFPSNDATGKKLKEWLISDENNQAPGPDDPPEKEEFLKAVKDFKNEMKQHFHSTTQLCNDYDTVTQKPKTVSFSPILDYSGNVFTRLYGSFQGGLGDDRHPYIAMYLYFLFAEGKQGNTYYKSAKPLFSYLIKKTLDKNSQTPIPYDYRDYRLIDATEGEALAKAALKYLTWGVEYTGYNRNDSITLGNMRNLVYQGNETEINDWMNSRSGTLENNYFAGNIFSVDWKQKNNLTTTIDKVHFMEGDFTGDFFSLVANKKSDVFKEPKIDNSVKISKVDFWTASNILWKTDAPDTNLNPTLYDKKRDATYHYSSQIDIGFSPSDPQAEEKIGGMCIVGKLNSVNDSYNNNMPESYFTLTSGEKISREPFNSPPLFLRDKKMVLSSTPSINLLDPVTKLPWDTEAMKWYLVDKSPATTWRSKEYLPNEKNDCCITFELYTGIGSHGEKINLKNLNEIQIDWGACKPLEYSVIIRYLNTSREFLSSQAGNFYGRDSFTVNDTSGRDIYLVTITMKKLPVNQQFYSIRDVYFTYRPNPGSPTDLSSDIIKAYGIINSDPQVVFTYNGKAEYAYDGDSEGTNCWVSDPKDPFHPYIILSAPEDVWISELDIRWANNISNQQKQPTDKTKWCAAKNILLFSSLSGETDPQKIIDLPWGERVQTLNVSSADNVDEKISPFIFEKPIRTMHLKIQFITPYQDNAGIGVYEITAKNNTYRLYWVERKDAPSVSSISCSDEFVGRTKERLLETQYRYIVFKYPIITNNLSLHLEKRNNIDVEELMVFDGDPIEYITKIMKNAQPGLTTISIDQVFKNPGAIADSLLLNSDIQKGISYRCFYNPGWPDLTQPKNEVWDIDPNNNWDTDNWFEKSRSPLGVEKSIQKPVASNILGFDTSKMLINFGFKTSFQLRQVVMYETVQSNPSTLLSEPVLLTALTGPLANLYLSNFDNGDFINKINATTPFHKNGKSEALAGNALPYAPLGVDCPRTFNYKMLEQKHTWEKLHGYRNTTLAVESNGNVENFNEHYIDEIEVNKAFGTHDILTINDDFTYASYPITVRNNTDKPFLPGYGINNKMGYVYTTPSPYNPEKFAGVDSIGMLEGSIAMSPIGNRFMTVNNENFGKKRNDFYAMKTKDEAGKDVNSPYLDSSGKPAFYMNADTISKCFSPGSGKLTMLDIERSSVLVPDISLIQKGDIIVKYVNDGAELDPHIGIVVGYSWYWDGVTEQDQPAKIPSYGDNASDWMDKVYVVNVRRSFATVTLGTWGNPKGEFGGFAIDPEAYQIRRLVVRKDITTAFNNYAGKETWDLVDKVYSRFGYPYPNTDRIPLDIAWAPNISSDSAAIAKIKVGVLTPKQGGNQYYCEQPKSDFIDRPAGSIFVDKREMNITSHNGWRYWANGNPPAMAYHKAIDIEAPQNSAIAAPEDGWFYYLDTSRPNALHIPFNSHMALDNPDDGLRTVVEYNSSTYGFLLVFVTNKISPEDGRVYVICHLGDTNETFDELLARLEIAYQSANPGKTWSEKKPVCLNDSIPVRAGEWIGLSGRKGEGNGWHIHLEVFEYFETIDDLPKTNSNRWRRVNPKSVFPEINSDNKRLWSYDTTEHSNPWSNCYPYFVYFRNNFFPNTAAGVEEKNTYFKLLPIELMYNDSFLIEYFKREGRDYSAEFRK